MSSRLLSCLMAVLFISAISHCRNEATANPPFDGRPVLGESAPPSEVLKISKTKGPPIYVSWCIVAVPDDYYCCALWRDGTVLAISKKLMVNKVVVLSEETFHKFKKIISTASSTSIARTAYNSPDAYPFHNCYVYDGKNEKFYSLDASELPSFENADTDKLLKVWSKLSEMRGEILEL